MSTPAVMPERPLIPDEENNRPITVRFTDDEVWRRFAKARRREPDIPSFGSMAERLIEEALDCREEKGQG